MTDLTDLRFFVCTAPINWSGSADCTASRTGLASCSIKHGSRSVTGRRTRRSIALSGYLAELERRALPKSVLGKAVSYARNQWQALRRTSEDGRLSIDNNVSERTLRHQAIGRKNWLFPGNKQAGPRAVVLFTVAADAPSAGQSSISSALSHRPGPMSCH